MLPTSFPDKEFIAMTTAKMLCEVEAIRFRTDEPFRFTSGWASPVYIDCRRLISYPRIRSTLMDFGASIILRDIGFEAVDAIAGGETAGIPFAAWLADRLMLPMQYVRKQSKGFGRGAQIEGDFDEGARILLVEDLTTDGGSKVTFIEALRTAGATVTDIFVVFFYGVFPGAEATMKDLGVNLHYLATWQHVLQAAEQGQDFSAEAIDGVRAFLDDPTGWSQAHGGKGDD